MGIHKRGFILRLKQAVERLNREFSFPYKSGIPDSDVGSWLESLKLPDGYAELFRDEGYRRKEDFINMRGLTRCQLRAMGITKRGEK